MKKVVVLLGVLCGASMLAHAETMQGNTDETLGLTQGSQAAGAESSVQQPGAIKYKTPVEPGADKAETGSGDDVDTVNEADPSHDKDPEAGDDTDMSSKTKPLND